MKLSEAFNEYIEENCVPRGNTERVIKNTRAKAVVIAKRMGNPKVEDIRVEDILKFRAEMADKLCLATQSSYLAFIRRTLRWQALKGRKVLNYQLIVLPKVAQRERQALTQDEVKRLEEATTCIRDRLLISLLYTSGIRVQELMDLNRDSVQDGAFYVVGKGHVGRHCFTDKKTMALLKLYLKQRKDENEALFISSRGNRMNPQLIDRMLKSTARRAGINKPVSCHVFRHSFATNLLQEGMNEIYIQRFLGHKMISTTSIYTHPSYKRMMTAYQRKMSQIA
jgi:integrase/recombinase XerD